MVASYVGIFYDDFCDALIQKSTEQWLVRMAARIVLDFYLEKKNLISFNLDISKLGRMEN
jgi:hypothetical protein